MDIIIRDKKNGYEYMDINEMEYHLDVRAIERRNRYKQVIEVKSAFEWPRASDLTEPAILGTYSIATLKTKTRYMLAPGCLKIARYGTDIETATSLARDYLREMYRQPRITHSQAELTKNQYMPLYARPSYYNNGYYIDIKSAWWSILLLAGWDVDYWPGILLAPGRPPIDFPYPLHKLARSALVSVAQSTTIDITIPGQLTRTQKPAYNRLLNWPLYALIAHVLGAIAIQAINAGAIYVNSDGYIAPNEESAEKILNIINQWGLKSTVKHEGKGWVLGPGCYRVGSYRTKRNMPPSTIRNISINPDYVTWLKGRWSWIANRNRDRLEMIHVERGKNE